VTTVADVAAESGRSPDEVLVACRSLGIVASSASSGLSADEHRRLRGALGAPGDLPPVVAGSTTAEPGAEPVPDARSLEARAEELAARQRRPRLSPRTMTRIGLYTFLVVAVIVSVVILQDRGAEDDPADAGERLCVDLPGRETATPRSVPCDGPHDAEVVARHALPDGPFPGQAALRAQAEQRCAPAVRPGEELVLLVPTEASWENGDRIASCLVAGSGR
jgi:hypothetical protein